MEVFRIAKCHYINDLSGTGGRSLAALEALVHILPKNLPPDFCIATIHIPEDISIKMIAARNLPQGWRTVQLRTAL